MFTKINSIGLSGIEGYCIQAETDVSPGLPAWELVGLPDNAVKEAKERVRAAIKHSGYQIPGRRMVINLAPAGIKKEGAYLDLPLAVGLLVASEQIKTKHLTDAAFFGELSLDGTLRSVNGALPMAIAAFQSGIRKLYLPKENAPEAAVVSGLEVYGVATLKELVLHLTGESPMEPTFVDVEELFRRASVTCADFSEVKGQKSAKRALEVAAAGGHNVLLIGPPGSGKTMLAQRLPSILPDLTFDEALEVTKVHSISGKLPKGLPMLQTRPFRSPHHTVSAAGLTGGGTNPKPGEVSLAHRGVLFLDELPEFRKDALEILRQPLEDNVVTITRSAGTQQYPCDVMLIASMNPCPCGYHGDETHPCSCSEVKIQKYLSKVSGPLLDRIDLHIEVGAVPYEDLEAKGEVAEASREIKQRVDRAREIQRKRYEKDGIFANARLTPALLEKYCALKADAAAMMKEAFENLGLSARAHNRILKVARTIADLDGSADIEISHLAEAIQYRSLDRKFWA